jgi:hypothetical protein
MIEVNNDRGRIKDAILVFGIFLNAPKNGDGLIGLLTNLRMFNGRIELG